MYSADAHTADAHTADAHTTEMHSAHTLSGKRRVPTYGTVVGRFWVIDVYRTTDLLSCKSPTMYYRTVKAS